MTVEPINIYQLLSAYHCDFEVLTFSYAHVSLAVPTNNAIHMVIDIVAVLF